MSSAHLVADDVDANLARQFVNWEFFECEEAVTESREAIMKEGGCKNFTHFLEDLCAQPHTNLHTLFIIGSGLAMPPLYGVERWGEDGLALRWTDLLKEEEEEAGSLERCMHAIGSLCCTSLRQLQLFHLSISPEHLNSLFAAMHGQPLPMSNSAPAASCTQLAAYQLSSGQGLTIHHDSPDHAAHPATPTLQCLWLWDLGNVGGGKGGNGRALLTLPPSLLFLAVAYSSEYEPLFQLAPPVLGASSMRPAAGAADAGVIQELAGEAAAHPSGRAVYTLSSLLGCPHLHLQGLRLYVDKIENGRLIPSDDDLRNAALSLAHNTYLKALSIIVDTEPLLPNEWATEGLKKNTSLTTLRLDFFRMPQPSGFDVLFEEGVAHNQTLTQLSLVGCQGPWTLEAILDGLQDNGSLHDIVWRGTPLQGNAAIGAQVGRNARSVEMMRSLGLNPRKVQPKAARVFLCGEAFAGKTTIVKSISNLFKSTWNKFLDKDWLLYSRLGRQRPRTKGIEVTSLERDGEKIVFWDMAGQDEYRCFHDYVFPDLSSRQSPSFFLFVWSPIYPGTEEKKTGERFCKEFEYWLKFITSKTRRSKNFIPKLIIAITRKDKVSNIKANLEHEITSRQEKFKDLINFGMNNVFEVDSRNPSSLKGLGHYIFRMSNDILKSMRPVLELKERIRILFEKKIGNKEISPIITNPEYINLCEQELGGGSHSIAESIALLLNESGDFIYGGSHKFVIIDARWFCHAIMGNLIHSMGPTNGIISEKGPGVFEKNMLQSFLEKEVLSPNGGMKHLFRCSPKRSQKLKTPQVSGETLLELLIELNMACEFPQTSKIFLPSSLGFQEDSLSSKEKIISSQHTTCFQLGRQLKCEDSEHTFLTPGVFPSLQVLFLNKFGGRVTLKRGFIDVNDESGVHAIVELCASEGVEHSIDILIRPTSRDSSYIVSWIQRELVEDIIKVCASSKGVQGVHLMQLVIGPYEKISLEHQRRQVVPLKVLKNLVEEDLIRNYDIRETLYAWPCTETVGSSLHDKVSNLLSVVEVQEVCEGYGKTLKELTNVINRDLSPFLKMETDKNSYMVSMSQNIDGEFENLSERILYEIREMKTEVHLIYNQVLEVNKGILKLKNEVCKRFQDMEVLIRQSEQRKLPTMWVLLVDRMRVIAKVVPGLHRADLHLLCEHRKQPHVPNNQMGLSFEYVKDESFLKMALPYMKIFLKIAYIATKVGVHLISSGGDLIPDFSKVISLVEDWSFSTPSLLELESSSNLPQGVASSSNQFSRSVYQERARSWLWQFLEKEQCDKDFQIKQSFKLQPVRYKVDGQIGWLCDEHCSEGLQRNELELINLRS